MAGRHWHESGPPIDYDSTDRPIGGPPLADYASAPYIPPRIGSGRLM